MDENKRKSFLEVLVVTFGWGLLAHGYCYFNLLFSHDSLLGFQKDSKTQITNGRFLHLLYWKFRGNIYAPALVGFLSLVFLGIAIWMILRLFRIEKKVDKILVCGILTTNITVALLNATFLHEADVYMLALLCAVGAVYLTRSVRYGFLGGIILVTCSLALYQSYIQVTMFLTILLAIHDILQGEEFSKTFCRGFMGLITIVAGLVLYAVALKLVLALTGNTASDEYNSLTRVGDGLRTPLQGILGAYAFVGTWFLHPTGFGSGLLSCLNLLTLAWELVMIIWIAVVRRIDKKCAALLVILLLIAPLGMNVVYLLSAGLEHLLMIYSFFLVYVFAVALANELGSIPEKIRKVLPGVVGLLLAVFLFDNVVFSNQVYLKKDLEFRSTMSIMTRVVDRMEQTEGYVPGETPVLMVGYLSKNPLAARREGHTYSATGLTESVAVTYGDTYNWYFDQILAYPVNLITMDELEGENLQPTMDAMGSFPARDSCRMEDGVLLIKFS